MERLDKRLLTVLIVVWVILFNLFVGIAYPGADYTSYKAYVKSLSHLHYIVEGDTLSPTGLIVATHSFGPALFWMPAVALRESFRWIAPDAVAWNSFNYIYIMQWFCAPILFWLLMRMATRIRATSFQIGVALFAGFFGTGFFYYTLLSISSEFPSMLLLSLMVYLIAFRDQNGRKDVTLLVIVFVFSIWTRFDNLLLVAILLAFYLLNQAALGLNRYRMHTILLLFAGLLYGMLPLLMVNYLYTGNPLEFSYVARTPIGGVIGYDWHALNTLKILFSPWHGLFVYNPFLVLALLGCLLYFYDDLRSLISHRPGFTSFLSRPLRRSLPYALMAYALMRLAVLSLSLGWHSGTGSFGGRFFAPFFPLAVVSFAYLLRRLRVERLRHPLVIVALIAVCWTFLLTFQERGNTNFYSFGSLLAGQSHALRQITRLPSAHLIPPAFVSAAAAILYIRLKPAIMGLAPLVAASMVLAGLILLSYPASGTPTASERLIVTGVLLILSLVWRMRDSLPRNLMAKGVTVVIMVYLLLVPLLLYAGYRSIMIVKDKPITNYKYCGTFRLELTIENYREFERLEGFDEEKKQIKEFVNEYLSYLEENTTCYSRLRGEAASPPLPEHIR